jgi:hypothetical protein
MANLGFSKRKLASIALLLACIFGSLFIDSMMKKKEGFQEGATNKGPSSEKELKKAINDVLEDTKKSSKENLNTIQDIIGKYIENNNVNTTVSEIINILNTKYDKEDETNNDKKINMIAVMLSNK